MKSSHAKHAVALLFLTVSQIEAFSTPMLRHEAGLPTSTSTELAGLRSFLKRKLSRSSTVQSPSRISHSDYSITPLQKPSKAEEDMMLAETRISASALFHSSHAPMPYVEATGRADAIVSAAPQLFHVESTPTPSSTTDTIKLDRKGNAMDKPHSLPPIGNRELTKLETEFRDMLTDFAQYTQRDIMAVRDPRMRLIFQGVAASFGLPEVYRAFEILFEDYAPLRIAGRLIYGKLKNVMEDAQLQRRKEVESVAELTGLPKEEIEASRSEYFKLVVHEDDTATEMTLQQIVDYGLAEMAVEVLGYEHFDDFVKSLKPCEMQKVDFERLMIALQSCPIGDPSPECNPSTVLQEISGRLELRPLAAKNSGNDEKKGKLYERYNSMVERVREWKSLVPSGDGRRLEVLRGCFVGAESAEIVGALRVVYIDYSALRMSGDLIFKVMATLVGRKGS